MKERKKWQTNKQPNRVKRSPKLSGLIICICNGKAPVLQHRDCSCCHALSITDSGIVSLWEAFFTLRSSKKLLSVNSVNDGFRKKPFPPHCHPLRFVSANSGRDECHYPRVFRTMEKSDSPPLLYLSHIASTWLITPHQACVMWHSERKQLLFFLTFVLALLERVESRGSPRGTATTAELNNHIRKVLESYFSVLLSFWVLSTCLTLI